MSVEIRTCAPEEAELFGQTISAVFGHELEPGEVERYSRVGDPERDLGAYDDGAMVGTTSAFTFVLTVPGGQVPAAGVTAVGVLPSHRRQGILTALMRRQLGDVHQRGEPLAVLWASEGAIYGRFGYGMASRSASIDVQRPWTRFREERRREGRVRLLTHEEALEAIPPVYERVRAVTPGFFVRSRDWWDALRLADPEHDRRGGGPMFRAVHELGGTPGGYALYRIHREGEWLRLHVIEALSTSPGATREIWRFLFDVDLVARVEAELLPADHPLFLMALEPSRLGMKIEQGLWVRLVDVGAALAARSYASDDDVVLEVADGFCPSNNARYRRDGSKTMDDPELRLEAADLGSVYLGGFSFAELARAGRVEELTQGALARADVLFRTDGAPWCPQIF